MAPRSLTTLFYWLGAIGLVLSLVAPLVYPEEIDTGAGLVHLVNLFTAALLVIAAGRMIALLEQIARSVRHPRPPEELARPSVREPARAARPAQGLPQGALGTNVA